MRFLFILITALLSFSTPAVSQLEAWFDYKVFRIPGEGAFVETHLNFTGTSLAYATQANGAILGQVETTILIKKGTEIIDFRKMIVSSPEFTDSTIVDFMDMQRFTLENGTYIFDIQLVDVNAPDKEPEILTQPFVIDQSDELPFVSDITFVKAYAPAETSGELTKSGVDILPYVNSYFPSHIDALIFYAEIYNTNSIFGEDEKFALTTSIISEEGEVAQKQQKIKRTAAKSVVPVLQTFDISELRSGNYSVLIEVRNRENEAVVSRSIDFFRNKYVEDPQEADLRLINIERTFVAEYDSREVIQEHINCLQPIASNVEQLTMKHQMETADLILMQQYFYHFWARRNSADPEGEWMAYKQEVDKVQHAFGTRNKKGYETDRGRIYLTYGPPNTMVERLFPENVYPYEIWHYYDLGAMHDRRFLFYDPTTVLADFALLHSDVPGEIQNFDWKDIMRGRESFSLLDDSTNNINQNKNVSFDFAELEALFYNPR